MALQMFGRVSSMQIGKLGPWKFCSALSPSTPSSHIETYLYKGYSSSATFPHGFRMKTAIEPIAGARVKGLLPFHFVLSGERYQFTYCNLFFHGLFG